MKKKFASAAILAGGKSARMGFDKQLLRAGCGLLVERTIACLSECFEDIILVSNQPELYAGLPVRACSDLYPGMGPLAGIHASLNCARSQYVYILACDMPYICLPYIRHMRERVESSGCDICVTVKSGWIEPFNSFWSVSVLPQLEESLGRGESSPYFLMMRQDTLIIPEEEARGFDPQLRMFTNLNTPEEYIAYLREAAI